jgi:glucokinase
MAVLALDLGGTKLASAVFSEDGILLGKWKKELGVRSGDEVGSLIISEINYILTLSAVTIDSVAIAVPGICNNDGTVWVPNIAGWENYPILSVLKKACGDIHVIAECDRSCYILGEAWKGNAMGCRNAVFIAVGTGIGAGILVNGEVVKGHGNIAGATGWMALCRPYSEDYRNCGNFEYFASGSGIAGYTRKLLAENKHYDGVLKQIDIQDITAAEVFEAYEAGDYIATNVINSCVELWGMAAANFISIFNPEKIIFGGGVFGPAVSLLGKIKDEASNWAQPVSMQQVTIEQSALGGDAGLYGAGFLAIQSLHHYHNV